tara:strand:+ start:145 stop:345 length:201 start_codon:yes stop_codon:yes gene_type:complete
MSDYLGFESTLDEDDYGIIIGSDGILKGIWVPEHLENDQIPAGIARFMKDTFGVDPNDQSAYNQLH